VKFAWQKLSPKTVNPEEDTGTEAEAEGDPFISVVEA
jgi:hypothetical protein